MTTLKLGSRGDEVRKLQAMLNCAVDGIFGPITEEAVKTFQKSKGLVVDGIVGIKTWGKLCVQVPVVTRKINKIIVHSTATPEGRDCTVDEIRQWHLARDFNDIGYHYVIYRDGSIHEGRSEAVIGAHCKGQNSNSIGVNYVGGCAADGKTPKDTRTPAQKQSLLKLLKQLKQKYSMAKIYGHRDFANTACPSFDARKEYQNI